MNNPVERPPICRRYRVSDTIDADLISHVVDDIALRGAIESYEAIIESLEAEKVNMALKNKALKDEGTRKDERLRLALEEIKRLGGSGEPRPKT